MFEGSSTVAPAGVEPAAVEVLLRSTADWLGEAPGGLLALAVEDRADRLATTSDQDLLRLVVAAERETSWLQAVQAAVIAELVRRPVMHPAGPHALDERPLITAEVGAALGLTRHSAERRVDLAERLAVELPATLAALRAGRIDRYRAQVISDELAAAPDLPRADREVIEAHALAGAPAVTAPQLRDRIRRALQAHKPADAAERHCKARKHRRVQTEAQPDGMGELWGYLPAETVTSVDTVLNALADRAAAADRNDPRTHEQRRADVLGDIFRNILDGRGPLGEPLGGPAGGSGGSGSVLPTRKGRRPHLVITIAASTLAGTDDQPATLAGYGPVPADLARRLAADAGTAQTACVDPDTGACQWIGKVTPYRPTQSILDQVIARDPICRHPGCRRPATQCDVDHVTRHPDGPTCPCNLLPLCKAHHRLKHDGGWRITLDPGTRTVTWTGRLGGHYTDPPVPLMPPAPQPPRPRTPDPEPPPF